MNTWDYLQKFGKPITISQLDNRLIGSQKGKVSKDLIRKIGQNLIEEEEYLKSYKRTYLNKIEIIKKASKIWLKIPYILMIGVTGSVASGYPDENDDIDVFFVCQKNSLWLSRILIYLYSKLHKIEIRRPGDKKEKNKMCLNLWLETDSLLVPTDKMNLKNAMDSILVEVIYGPDIYKKFLEINTWIGRFVANGYINNLKRLNEFSLESKKSVANRLRIVEILNTFCYWISHWYMNRLGNELVNKKQAFFHP